jgi:hypothetical protein
VAVVVAHPARNMIINRFTINFGQFIMSSFGKKKQRFLGFKSRKEWWISQ